jgi:hypothetical protein
MWTSPQNMWTSPQNMWTSPQNMWTSPQNMWTSPQNMWTSPHILRTGFVQNTKSFPSNRYKSLNLGRFFQKVVCVDEIDRST